MVCGMAEGTDLLAAAARPGSWQLEPVLALPVDQWRNHLAMPPARVPEDLHHFDELLDLAGVPVIAPTLVAPNYGWVGCHIASTCRHLVAVWDGRRGKQGGTSEVVALAQERGIPVTTLWDPDWSVTNQE